jgi:hypothetical protein
MATIVWEIKNAEWHLEVFDDDTIKVTECLGGTKITEEPYLVMPKSTVKSLAVLLSLIPN